MARNINGKNEDGTQKDQGHMIILGMKRLKEQVRQMARNINGKNEDGTQKDQGPNDHSGYEEAERADETVGQKHQ